MIPKNRSWSTCLRFTLQCWIAPLYGSLMPERIAIILTTEAVASAQSAALRNAAVRSCCNWFARSREALACLRAIAFDPPASSTARYLSSILLASVLLTVTSSSGGCRSGSKTVCASEMITSRHSRPTVWNCSSVDADANRARASPNTN